MKRGILLLALVLVFSCWESAWAVTGNNVITAQTPKAYKAQIVNGSGVVTLTATTNYVSVATGASASSRLNSVICTSNDAASHNIAVAIVRSATLYPLGVVAIGSASATSVTTANILTSIPGLPVDSDGNAFLPLESTDQLEVGVLTTAVTASDAISCMSNAADF